MRHAACCPLRVAFCAGRMLPVCVVSAARCMLPCHPVCCTASIVSCPVARRVQFADEFTSDRPGSFADVLGDIGGFASAALVGAWAFACGRAGVCVSTCRCTFRTTYNVHLLYNVQRTTCTCCTTYNVHLLYNVQRAPAVQRVLLQRSAC